MAAKKKKQTKTAYVLSLPRDLPAKAVVDKGKAAGISLTEKHVYSIRSDARRREGKTGTKAGARKKPGPKPGAKRSAANGTTAMGGSVEARFVDLVLDVGIGRAEELLAKLRAKVKSIVL
jgi:hypothetical protein